MDIHEHQAKELFKLYNIPTPEGKAVFSVEDATKAANELPGPVYVLRPKYMQEEEVRQVELK